MRYKTFRALTLGGVLAVGAGGGYVLLEGRDDGPEPDRVTPTTTATTPATATATATAAAPPPSASDRQPLRPIDQRILERLGTPLADGKGKDVFAREAVKVNLYQDGAASRPNRVKIDLDRDDRWDEKWTVSADGILREVSPSDDDRTYPERWRHAGDAWVREGVAAAPPAATAAAAATQEPPPGPGALRPLDGEILERVRRGVSGDKAKDAIPSAPYKVNLYRDPGHAAVNRAKIDLDRDEKWDEKWTFVGDEVKRQVAPADDERYTEEYRLRAGAWVKK
jgi:hypothetical protein